MPAVGDATASVAQTLQTPATNSVKSFMNDSPSEQVQSSPAASINRGEDTFEFSSQAVAAGAEQAQG